MNALTDAQIWERCAAEWKKFNTWNLSYDDFLRASFQRGPSGKGRMNGYDDSPGDTVYTTPEGNELTRFMAEHWCQHWRTYSTGFLAAWNLCQSPAPPESK